MAQISMEKLDRNMAGSSPVDENGLGMFMMSCAFTKEIAKIMNWPILDTKNQFLK